MAADLFAANRPIKIRFRCGEHLDKLVYLADTVDITTDPPTLTNPQDFTDWSSTAGDMRWAVVSGNDARVAPVFVGTMEVSDPLGILRIQATSTQTASLETGGHRNGILDLWGVDPAGRHKRIRQGVWFASFSAEETFS